MKYRSMMPAERCIDVTPCLSLSMLYPYVTIITTFVENLYIMTEISGGIQRENTRGEIRFITRRIIQ